MNAKLITYSILTCLCLVACNGGGSKAQIAEGGIGGTGITNGSVTQFGSIYVNGIKFDTSQAKILIKNQLADESQLQLGMYVSVQGTVSADGKTGTAEKIIFTPVLEGVVESISLAQKQMIVSGNIVEFDQYTLFDGVSKEMLKMGDKVVVSGSQDASRRIHASYIKLGSIGTSFSTNTPIPTAGAAPPVTTVQPASTNISLSEGWASVDGLVTQISSTSNLMIANVPIVINSATSFVNGTSRNISINTRLIATGNASANGSLTAQRIEIMPSTTLNTNGQITALDQGKSLLYLNSQAIEVRSSTIMIDSSEKRVRRFGLPQLMVGDKLNVETVVDGSTVVAVRVERL